MTLHAAEALERPIRPTRQQVLSIAELRKTSNEIALRAVTHPVTEGHLGILHNGWCNSKKDSILVNFACERGPLGMLVSIPFP